jgi:PAS domain S-box-containing protein
MSMTVREPLGVGASDTRDRLQPAAEEAERNLRSEQARKLVGNASPESGQLLQAILENSPAVVSVKDVHGRCVLVNRRYEALIQVTLEQIAGRTDEQTAGRTDHDVYPKEIADALRANGSVRAHRGAPSGEIVAALFDEVHAFSQDLQRDDMTAAVIRVRPG